MLFWKGVIDLYINPILVGVIGTILAEFLIVLAYAMYSHFKG